MCLADCIGSYLAGKDDIFLAVLCRRIIQKIPILRRDFYLFDK